MAVSPAEVKAVLSQQEGLQAADGPPGLPERVLPAAAPHAGGDLELRVPQDRARRFSTKMFESYARRENALVAALAQT